MIKQENLKRNNDILPRILIGAPQSDKKNYCFDEWLQNVRNFTYPKEKLEIFLADNSDTPDNYRKIKKLGLKAAYIPRGKRDILERITESHNAVRLYCLKNGFSFLLHLETDIFPQENIIEMLLFHRQKITAATYHIGEYTSRNLCVLGMDDTNNFKESYMIPEGHPFYDGTLKQCHSAGLGCILIHRSILEKIPFRYQRGYNAHPDTFFAMDCELQKIPIHVDTSLFALHKNKTHWGKFGIDFK